MLREYILTFCFTDITSQTRLAWQAQRESGNIKIFFKKKFSDCIINGSGVHTNTLCLAVVPTVPTTPDGAEKLLLFYPRSSPSTGYWRETLFLHRNIEILCKKKHIFKKLRLQNKMIQTNDDVTFVKFFITQRKLYRLVYLFMSVLLHGNKFK